MFLIIRIMSTPSSNSSWDEEEMATESGCEKIELLDSIDDAYGGVMVDLKESMDSEAFASRLRASIALWIQQVSLFFVIFSCFFDNNIQMFHARRSVDEFQDSICFR